MITNIIKNIIKEFPQVANSPIIKVCENKEQHQLTIAPADYDNLMIVITAKTSVPTSSEEWKRNAIAEHIYSTRNEIAHAKANYEKRGTECPAREKASFCKMLEIIAIRCIRWFAIQPEEKRVVPHEK